MNTKKMALPLPDIESIACIFASHKCCSIMGGKGVYERIRVKPDHVLGTIFTTTDSTIKSLVLQQGDYNGGATYQASMNHIFAPYVRKLMDVYLHDIVICSDTIAEHLEHVQIVLDILRQEKLSLGVDKICFFSKRTN